MTAEDFRRIALSLEGVESGTHMGSEDFRVGGRIFATLANVEQGYGNLMLDAERQAAFVQDAPHIFIPVRGGWGRNGATHIKLDVADEPTLRGALTSAWALRRNKSSKTKKARRRS